MYYVRHWGTSVIHFTRDSIVSIIFILCTIFVGILYMLLLFPYSKHLPDDWLERMYHSCQHRHPPIPESLDHPEMHPMLMSYLVS